MIEMDERGRPLPEKPYHSPTKNRQVGPPDKLLFTSVFMRTHIRFVCRWHAELAVDRLRSTWFATFLSVVQSLTLVDYLAPPGNRDALDSEHEVIGVSCLPFVIQADCCKRATLVPNGVDSGWASSAGRSELARSRKECGREDTRPRDQRHTLERSRFFGFSWQVGA